MKITDNKEKQAAMDLAEDSREQEWQFESFVGELFKGNFRWDLIHPYPTQSPSEKAIGDKLVAELEAVLKANIDPETVDRDQEVPKAALDALAAKGYFGMKISKKYGGLGLSVYNYTRAMAVIGSYCGSTAVWLSAHQSIGVPQPLKLFGTEAQKEKFLPRLAKGAISAFALTEPDVGSDPAKMSTIAVPTPDGKHYIINGEKLYITNGPAAELLVVMALTPPVMVKGKERKQITAFIVERNTPGFEVLNRCQFMGIRGIANGRLKFTNIKGLKIALTTLNAGRLAIPAISAAAGKAAMSMAANWSNKRIQWGLPVGQHQAVQIKLAEMAANTFAIDSVAMLASAFADHESADIRLEAAMAKYMGSEMSWKIADDLVQIRGGRGFETATSLKNRGEEAYPAERMLRDLRINRIIEGTSEVMQLFIAREAMDVHLRFIMGLMKPGSLGEKLGIVGKIARFYSVWYPKQWISLPTAYHVKHLDSRNQCHLRYIQKTAKKLARKLFHTMARYQIALEKEQLILAHFVDVGTDLFAMAASLSRAEYELSKNPDNKAIQELVDLFCTQAKSRICRHFASVSSNPYKKVVAVSKSMLEGKYDFMFSDVILPE